MGLMIAHEPAPLQATEDGVVRVGGTRVTLDTVVTAFEEGATAEEIVQHYPALRLAATYRCDFSAPGAGMTLGSGASSFS